jgi:hypothetical protein
MTLAEGARRLREQGYEVEVSPDRISVRKNGTTIILGEGKGFTTS